MTTHGSNFVRIPRRIWNWRAKNCPKKAQKLPKNQFLNFWYNRVRLPGGLIFGLPASLGSYGHRTMLRIFVEYFLYQSLFRTAVQSINQALMKYIDWKSKLLVLFVLALFETIVNLRIDLPTQIKSIYVTVCIIWQIHSVVPVVVQNAINTANCESEKA